MPPDINTLLNNINDDLRAIKQYCELNKLLINIKKTKAMCFFYQVNKFNIQYDNINIDIVDEFKFLGYYINKILKFKTHCDMLIKKLSSFNFILYKFKINAVNSYLSIIYI